MGDSFKLDNNIIKNLDSFSFVDKEEIYTNGSDLIQSFRVIQIIEAMKLQELVDRATLIKPNRVICKTQISEYSTMIEHKVYCPICNTRILIEGSCCPNNDCRQAIDWNKND